MFYDVKLLRNNQLIPVNFSPVKVAQEYKALM